MTIKEKLDKISKAAADLHDAFRTVASDEKNLEYAKFNQIAHQPRLFDQYQFDRSILELAAEQKELTQDFAKSIKIAAPKLKQEIEKFKSLGVEKYKCEQLIKDLDDFINELENHGDNPSAGNVQLKK